MTIAALLLAAGASARLGSPKQLVRLGSKTLIRHSAEALLSAASGPVYVVLGAHADRLLPELGDIPVTPIVNPDWPTGMASSIRAGLTALLAVPAQPEAVLISVCDQPHVTAADLIALIGLFRRSGAPLAAAAYNQTCGVPAVFARALFPELLALQGPAGARQVIVRHLSELAALPLPHAAVDIDTAADLIAQGLTPDTSAPPPENPR